MRSLLFSWLAVAAAVPSLSAQTPLAPGYVQTGPVQAGSAPFGSMPPGNLPPGNTSMETIVEVAPPQPGRPAVGLGLPPGAIVPASATPVSATSVAPAAGPEVNVRHEVDPYTREPYRGYPISYPSMTRPMVAPPGPGVLPVSYPTSPVLGDPQGYQTGPCGQDPCCRRAGSPFLDNLSFFFGLDGAKEPLDLGLNGNFGTRLAMNWGLPVVEEWGVGMQVGFGWNYERNALRVLPFFTGVSDHSQIFTTVGVFQRTSAGLNYGLAWDFRSDNYFEGVDTTQWRGQISLDLGCNDEVGVVGTLRGKSDPSTFFGAPIMYRPINQLRFFWRHVWENDIVTKVWAGMAEEHSRFNPLLPPEPTSHHPFLFGGDVFVPLTNRLALYGEANIITPNDTGVITAMIGFAWFPSASARSQAHSRFAPMFPLANNTSFSLDVQP